MLLNLRQLRAERGLTQDQLSEMTGLSKGFLSQLETGARQPSTESISILSNALKVSETDLIAAPGFSDPPADTMARRVLNNLDRKATEPDFKLGTDGKLVQIIATVNREGLTRLIKQLEIMKDFLEV